MKSQNSKQKNKQKKEWWNCGITNSNTNIFPKKKPLMTGQKLFWAKKV